MLPIDIKLSTEVFSSTNEKIATRDGYGDGVVVAGEQDENVVVVCADVTESTRSQKFKERFPGRFIEAGVAEQNMAGIAAGLALGGKVPFMASYAVFSPGRNWDQVRVSICYSRANVKMVGAHAGLSVGPDGAAHQALEDIAITRVLPNLVVINPCDYEEAKKATIAIAKHKGPVYIRLAREKSPVMTTPETPFEIGKAQLFMEGRDVTIISCGPILHEAMKAALELSLKHGITCDVINCATVKPLDEEVILASARKTGRIVTVEEHQISGGLGGAVAELTSRKHPIPVMRIGVEDSFGESGEPHRLWEKYGLTSRHIVAAVKEIMIGEWWTERRGRSLSEP